VAGALLPGVLATPASAADAAPSVTVAVLPKDTDVAQLARIKGMGLGLMSGAVGSAPQAQTYLDVSQGNRLGRSLYSRGLPKIRYGAAPDGGAQVDPGSWRIIRDRASSAPAELTPGLLASTLAQAGIPARGVTGPQGLMAATEPGRWALARSCAEGGCPGLTVVRASRADLPALARRVRGNDLLIVFSRPPEVKNHELTVGILGAGFDGQLTSESTHTPGLVLATDLAPTILGRLGIAPPSEMSGQPITVDGATDAGALQDLQDRLAQISPRRHTVIGVNLTIWVIAALAAAAIWRRRGLETVIPLAATTLAFAPFLMLIAPAFEPSELAERLIVGVGSPLLALGAIRLAGAWGGLAIAAAASVGGYAIDVIAGSGLTTLSLMGPNPSLGVRFYGIGNELEAMAAALVFTGTGAALQRWGPGLSPRRAALAFGGVGLATVIAFAPGRFGADVGAAIDLPVGAALAAAVCLGVRRSRALLIVLVPFVMVGLLAAADLVTGGDSHLTRSVLQAGGLHDLGNVAERRLRLSATSFSRYAVRLDFLIVVALSALAIVKRDRIAGWFANAPLAWAGVVGAVGATIVGTLANDSGALLFMIGAALIAGSVGVAWACQTSASSEK
jgi:hypothetical protein